jgi:outer membrane protein OmpA-like peptidoglycan-associated protein
MKTRSLVISLAATILVAGSAGAAPAQLGRIGRAVKSELERKAEKAAVDAVRCIIGDDRCVRDAKAAKKDLVITDTDGRIITDAKGRPVTTQADAARLAQQPGEGVWRNYDFVPGATVWKVTDFSGEPVGRFPARQIEFVRGNMQIVEFEGEKVLEISASSVMRLALPQALPRAFTLEFDVWIPAPNFITSVFFSPLETATSRYEFDYLQVYARPGVYRRGREVSNMSLPRIQNRWTSIKLQVDDTYAIAYADAERVAQVPAANFARENSIEVRSDGNQRFRTYLKNFVVAVGLERLYDALTTTGEFTTRGILFDVDSDRLRPESTPALTEILTTLEEHADLRIVVEGHTDSQGDDAHNQDLSERRARAVVQYLTAQGIAASRLSAAGKGESQPVADNATAEGRQQNRRVVLRRPS